MISTPADEPVPSRTAPKFRYTPVVAAVVGIVVFGLLALGALAVADQSEDSLLRRQTDEASVVLASSVESFRAPLDGAARAARATEGDPDTFEAIVAPLMGENSVYSRFQLIDLGTSEPIAEVGTDFQLAEAGRTDDLLTAAAAADFVILDLLDQERTLGYAVTDGPDDPRYLVYAERTLAADPNVRRRSEDPFSNLDYAIYLGGSEDAGRLLGASGEDLPLDGRRATSTIPFGDQELLFVATPIGRLGSGLTTNLWWMVLLVGVVMTALMVALLHRLSRSRQRAVTLAEENARQHAEQRDIAETLQTSLLPQRLVPPPGTRLASRYWPAGSAMFIGGDFYDVFRIDDRRWGFVIGDVCGKGVEAAALTGLVRHTIRAAARTTDSPAAALQAVHVAMLEHQPATYCTVCFMTYIPDRELHEDDDREGRLVMALGGHPQPLLASRHGTIRTLGEPGTLLGMLEPSIVDTSDVVRAGDTIVLYTDGLTDAPGIQSVPIAEVEELLAERDDADVDTLADSIRALKRRRRPSGSQDDTALLVVRFESSRPAPFSADPDIETASVGTLTSIQD